MKSQRPQPKAGRAGRRDLVVPNLRRGPNIRPFDQH